MATTGIPPLQLSGGTQQSTASSGPINNSSGPFDMSKKTSLKDAALYVGVGVVGYLAGKWAYDRWVK